MASIHSHDRSSGDQDRPHLPAGFVWFRNQVAGHGINGKPEDIGIIKKTGTGQILKILANNHRGKREGNFYTLVNGLSRGEKVDIEIQKMWPFATKKDCAEIAGYMPPFHNIETVFIQGRDEHFLNIDDVTYGYAKPSIIDIKIGNNVYSPCCSSAKKEKERTKHYLQKKLGFRITGFQTFEAGEKIVRRKSELATLDEAGVAVAFRQFFSGRGGDFIEAIMPLLEKLGQLKEIFNSQTSFHIFASSVLIVYEASMEHEVNMKLYMIDFAYTYNAEGEKDKNYASGLNGLSDFLQKL